MRKSFVYGVVLLVLGVNLLVGTKIYFYSVQASERDMAYPSLELFSYVMEKVRKEYVDGEDITYQDLIYGALKGMLNTLDPHSEFMEPDQYQELQKDTEGRFGGLGIVISMKDNFITVVAPMEDTPGFEAGILSGDRIIRIDGNSTEHMSLQDAVKRLRGRPGTKVTMTIMRPLTNEVKEYTLTRADIKITTVKDIDGRREFPLGEDKIGYIRIAQFGDKTGKEFTAALEKLRDQGMEALVLDLRWNPGGLLEQAVEVAEKFLPRGELVVTTEGRTSSQSSYRRARGRGRSFSDTPVAVLVNLGSASASEIVAGALQDLTKQGKCKVFIVGEQTFGKGSVQSIIPLNDGSALRLTTAKYYTPSHTVIHEKGITPDILVPMTPDEERAVLFKRAPGGLESLAPEDREAIEAVNDPQLDRARDVLKGIILFTQRNEQHQRDSSGSKRMAARTATSDSGTSVEAADSNR